MIPKNERDKHKAILAAATPLPWRWWTSNSMRRLSSDPTGKDGDVAHAFQAADGVPDIAIREADMAAIETAVNALGRYIADAEEMDGRIEALLESARRHDAGEIRIDAEGKLPPEVSQALDNTAAAVLRIAVRILRGDQ